LSRKPNPREYGTGPKVRPGVGIEDCPVMATMVNSWARGVAIMKTPGKLALAGES